MTNNNKIKIVTEIGIYFSIHPPPGLLPELGLLTRYMTPALDAALLISHVCGSRDHINIEHAYGWYSLPKRDSILRPKECLLEFDAH